LAWSWEDGTVAVLDLNRSDPPTVIAQPSRSFSFNVGRLLFSPDGRYLVKSSTRANCQVWDVSTGIPKSPTKELIATEQQNQFNYTLFTADSQFLLVHERLTLVAYKVPNFEEHFRITDVWQWTTLPTPGDTLIYSVWRKTVPRGNGLMPYQPFMGCSVTDKAC